jgi:hypothetical protein
LFNRRWRRRWCVVVNHNGLDDGWLLVEVLNRDGATNQEDGKDEDFFDTYSAASSLMHANLPLWMPGTDMG